MTRLGTVADIARELGVPVNRVRSWYRFRENNRFPEHVLLRKSKTGIPDARHYDLDAVVKWHATYRPHIRLPRDQ